MIIFISQTNQEKTFPIPEVHRPTTLLNPTRQTALTFPYFHHFGYKNNILFH